MGSGLGLRPLLVWFSAEVRSTDVDFSPKHVRRYPTPGCCPRRESAEWNVTDGSTELQDVDDRNGGTQVETKLSSGALSKRLPNFSKFQSFPFEPPTVGTTEFPSFTL